MAGVAIVAIPREDDPVWKVSSEQVPHMTVLFLGSDPANIDKIVQFTEHVAETSLTRFTADVDRRGLLGPEDADVLFFRQNDWGLGAITRARASLLQNDAIKIAYDSTPQFDGWTPHLTLGFPATPAKPDLEHPISWVSFDRLAVWTSNYEGPTFDLKDDVMDITSDMAMSDVMDTILKHHGVKGMKWGVRKDRPGSGHPTHPDASKAKTSHQKAKRSGVSSLSNDELKALNKRLNLESEFRRLNAQTKSEGQKFLEEELKKLGRQHIAKLTAKTAAKLGAALLV